MYKCRACLIKCEEDQMSSMTLCDKLPNATNISIADALSEIACIFISNGANCPTKICSSCCYRLEDAYMFIKRVQESALIIHQWEQSAENSQCYTVPIVAEQEQNTSVKNELDSWKGSPDDVINKDCLEDVRIANVQTCNDVNFHDPKEDFVAEDEIKKEPDEVDEALCGSQYSDLDDDWKEASKTDDNSKLTWMEDRDVNLSNGNISALEDRSIKCVCRYFHRADFISEDTKQSIRNRFTNMDEETRSLYIRSLLHACRCGKNPERQNANHENSPGEGVSSNSNEVVIVYTLECTKNEYVSVSREMFIEVFGLVEKRSPTLEDVDKSNDFTRKCNKHIIGIQNDINKWIKLKMSSDSGKKVVRGQNDDKHFEGVDSCDDEIIQKGINEYEIKKKEQNRIRCKRYRDKKKTEAIVNTQISKPLTFEEEEKIKRRREKDREKSQRYRDKKRAAKMTNLQTDKSSKPIVKNHSKCHNLHNSQIAGPSTRNQINYKLKEMSRNNVTSVSMENDCDYNLSRSDEDDSSLQSQQCMLCAKYFKSLATLKRHVIVFHSYLAGGDRPNVDDEDNHLVGNKLQEIKKIKSKKKIKKDTPPCCFCYRKFASLGALASHKKFCYLKMKKRILRSTS